MKHTAVIPNPGRAFAASASLSRPGFPFAVASPMVRHLGPGRMRMADLAFFSQPAVLAAVALASGVATALVIPPLMPVLARYALARPNARSSHRVPTPQGGGIAVVGVALAIVGLALAFLPVGAQEARSLLTLVIAAAGLALLGAWDDIRPLPALPRFGAQVLAVGATVFMLPPDVRILPELLPVSAERVLVTIAGVWFVNLTNFMDGIDWITAAQFVPVCGALALLAALGAAPPAAGLVAAALAGALAGFMPANRPVARLFLGDVGSLPIGLLAGYALVRLAGEGHLLAALALPLYYLADATITLLRRLARREKVWEAHRSHFYQRATVNGLTVTGVVARIALANAVLAGLALVAALAWTPARGVAVALAAAGTVAALLADLSRRRGSAP